MISNSEVSFCVDTLLVETVLAEPKFYKKAGFVSDLLTRVKGYFDAHIDKSNPVASLVDIFAPGAISMLFGIMGFGKFGLLLGLLMNVFHVDVYGILSSLWNKVKGMISGGQKVSSSQIDSAVNETAQQFNTPPAPSEASQAYQQFLERQSGGEGSWADDGKVYSSLELLEDAKLINLALIEYESQNMRLTKEAAPFNFMSMFAPRKSRGVSILSKIFGWVIKLALISAGLMVGGDIINALIGRPSALTGTYQAGKTAPESTSSTEPASTSAPQTTQTKFKFKRDVPLPATWPLANNPANIENMLIQFAKDVYDGLEGKEDIIRNTPSFQNVKDQIDWFNIHNTGSAVILLPKIFGTEKHLVDYFIDDVANRSP